MKPRTLLACLLSILASPASVAFAAGPFQPEFRLSNFHAPLVIDNAYSPMQPGTRTVSYELEDGECKVNDVVVTHAAKHDFKGAYAGLAARKVTDKVWSDPQCNGKRALLLEDTQDWYGQDNGGNVWYFGEATVEYTYDAAGNRIDASHEGSWQAGSRGAKAGIVMFNRPVVGTSYLQEFEAGVAEDAALIQNVGIRVETGLGRFHDCIRTRETTALTPGDVEYKYYCRNLGVVRVEAPLVHGGAELVQFGLR
ncbi:hypothetical protein AB4059_04095 [Lysobacter sp. 2RAF19]